MRRLWGELLALAASVASVGLGGACAFEAGQPWGRAEVALTAAFSPGADRLTDDGLLRTSNNYLIDVTSLSVRVGAVTLTMTAAGAEAVSFDPADPPAGFSLCHGGHCHADDGRLVAYADVEAEVAGGGASGASVEVPVGADVALKATPTTVALGPCPDGCRLEPGDLSRLAVSLGELRFEARVFDIAPGDGKGLPDEGVPIRGVVPLTAAPSAALSGAVGDGEPVGVRLAAALAVTDSLFDGVDWTGELGLVGPVTEAIDAGGFPAVAERIAENVAAGSELVVELDRFDP